MSVEQITKALDAIESKYQDFDEKHTIKSRELADEILQLKQRGGMAGTGTDVGAGFASKGGGLGATVWSGVQENADLLAKTSRVRFEVKAAADAITTTSGRKIASGNVGAPEGMALGVQNGLPQRIAGATAIEYSRYTGIQGAAAVQATEGAAKAAVRPDHTLVTQQGITIAGYSKISKQALTDSAALQRAVDTTLRRSIAAALDSVIVAGSGTWGGLATLGTAYTSLLYTGLADAASEAVATMQEAGFNPDLVAMRPSDWLALQVARGTANDHYLAGSYLAPLPELLRGMRVVLSPTVAAGKCHVIDSAMCELLIVDDMSVEIGTDADDFTKNLRTILGEVRVIPTFYATGAVRVITPKA